MTFYNKELKGDEELIRIIREYPLSYLSRFLFALLFLLAPFFFIIPLFRLEVIGFIGFAVFFVAGLIMTIRVLVMAYLNCFLVTSHRVIDLNQRGLFDRAVSEVEYPDIQDISYRVKGILGTLFDYGVVQVQTMGASVILELRFVRHPRQVQSLIMDIKRNTPTHERGE